MTVASAALAWQASGFSTIPIAPNAAKRPGFWKKPATRWKDYQTTAPSLEQVSTWWGNGHEYGLALIMGKVSGNAEMLEIEGRACDSDSLTLIANAMDDAGVGHVWDMFNSSLAYSELSPYGGLHFIYRLSTGVVPGNEKIARRPATADELAENPDDKIKVLSETRGEGGYVIVAPTSGLCHPSGENWVLINGVYGVVPSITWEERCLVHEAIRRALDESESGRAATGRGQVDRPALGVSEWGPGDDPLLPAPTQRLPALPAAPGRGESGEWGDNTGYNNHAARVGDATSTQRPWQFDDGQGQGRYDTSTGQIRPGDALEEEDWDSSLLLGGAGWQVAYTSGATRYWTRPGKSTSEGISATTGHAGDRDRLFVFSTSTPFPTEQPLTKFAAFAILHHGGNHSAAASDLRGRGLGGSVVGSGRVSSRPGGAGSRLRTADGGSNPDGADAGPLVGVPPTFSANRPIDEESCHNYLMDDLGACQRLLDRFDRDVVYAAEEKQHYRWDLRGVWRKMDPTEISAEYTRMTVDMAFGDDEEERKWARTKLRTGTRASWVVRNMHFVDGVGVSASQFNVVDAGKLNLRNGVLDLRTGVLTPHDKHMLLTRQFNASYDPDATCPRFDEFMEQVLPDPATRSYVQRAVGYSMLGDASERAMFLVWGPSGTGKSQFMETVQHVFGDYGATAGLGAFMGGRDTGPSDAHQLRSKRFVSTSETADDARFNEETVKRLTGSDTMSTRTLYQQPIEWRPECAIWIATNHKPKFASDDDAIWRRSKLIPFTTRFGQDGGPAEVVGFARRFLFAERDGILNWMLEGLRQYLEVGLDEPVEITAQALMHRQEVDTVAQFLDDSEADQKLVRLPSPLGVIGSGELYTIYAEWCRATNERPFGRRRFTNRVLANWPEVVADKRGGKAVLTGLARGTLAITGGGGLFTQSEKLE